MAATDPAVEFRVFGGIELTGADRRDVTLVLHQTKRLALFSYLVLSRPAGFRRRDELIALFWPQFDAEHAHNALRQAVHYLRRGLGAAVVRRRGSQDLGVDEHAIWCDATQFERAIRQGRLAEALVLYRGDLLPGLFVAQASAEFDQWLDAERLRLRRLASDAAWAYSAQLDRQGDVTGSIEWARRASDLAVFDEIALRRLIHVLKRHGDHVGAMQAYDRFRSKISADRRHVVSLETARLVEGFNEAVEGNPARHGRRPTR
jgi:DNA-binding SARP family transcriptional activator